MKPITTCYILFIIITALTSCGPDLKSRTDDAINLSKSKFPNLGIQSANGYQMVRKLEIRLPQATIQLLEPAKASGDEAQIIVFSNA
jgi:outer membrane lipopolysaccharide assembly protein LptE/RlpB